MGAVSERVRLSSSCRLQSVRTTRIGVAFIPPTNTGCPPWVTTMGTLFRGGVLSAGVLVLAIRK